MYKRLVKKTLIILIITTEKIEIFFKKTLRNQYMYIINYVVLKNDLLNKKEEI